MIIKMLQRHILLRTIHILLLFILTTSILQAQEKKQPKQLEDHYHLSLFAGFSTDLKGNAGYKLGIEYEYRLNKRMGVGGTFDFTGKDFKIFSFSVGADFYLFKFPLILGAAIGAKNSHSKWKPFVRGIAVYDFHFGQFSFGPIKFIVLIL
jgi:hypothetical protein